MYGLPSDFNPDIFIGCTLEMICYSQTDLYLHFGESIMITIGSHIGFDGEIYETPIKATNILSLIGNKVVRSIANKEGDLKIYFNEYKFIEIIDSHTNFESYSIQIGNRTVFV